MRSMHLARIAVLSMLALSVSDHARAQLLPFAATGDLYVLDDGSDSVLRLTPGGGVAVAITEAELLLLGVPDVDFDENGLAFDELGNLYLVEQRGVVKRAAGDGSLSVLVSQDDLLAAQGQAEASDGVAGDADALVIGSDGFIYVTDDWGDSVLRIDPDTGAVTVHTSRADLAAVSSTADVEHGLVAVEGGALATSFGTEIFALDPAGVPTLLAGAFASVDTFATRAPNGDLIVPDDDTDTIFRVTSAGLATIFLSEAELEAVTGTDVDLDGGIAFDSLGNFYVADDGTDSILKFDPVLNGSIFVSAAEIEAVTGTPPELAAGIAFAPLRCAAAPRLGCVAAAKAKLTVKETVAGKEKLKAKLGKLDIATVQADFGDPVAGSTRLDVCIYDGTDVLAGELSVERAGALCGPKAKPCWKASGSAGFQYRDPAASSSGVRAVKLKAGAEAKGKLQVQAANKAKKSQLSLPTGIAAALAGAQSATLQIVASDGSCFDAALGTVSKADGSQFKAKAP